MRVHNSGGPQMVRKNLRKNQKGLVWAVIVLTVCQSLGNTVA